MGRNCGTCTKQGIKTNKRNGLCKKSRNWRMEVNTDVKADAHLYKFIDMMYNAWVWIDVKWLLRSYRRRWTSPEIIIWGDATPTFAAHTAGPKRHDFDQGEIEKTLNIGITKLVGTTWTIPIVFQPRNDGSLPFFVDWWKLNVISLCNLVCIPIMDECLS